MIKLFDNCIRLTTPDPIPSLITWITLIDQKYELKKREQLSHSHSANFHYFATMKRNEPQRRNGNGFVAVLPLPHWSRDKNQGGLFFLVQGWWPGNNKFSTSTSIPIVSQM
jgi:hypothetical protein